MKFEAFIAGKWQRRYQYQSFEPVPVNHDWTWEEPSINTPATRCPTTLKFAAACRWLNSSGRR